MLIDEDSKTLNYKKWNDLVYKSIAFDNFIANIMGKRYKGSYDENFQYKEHDYLWVDNTLCIIENDTFKLNRTLTHNDIKRNVRERGNIINYLDSQNHIKRLKDGNIIQISEVPFDKFELFKTNEAVAKNGNRFVNINFDLKKISPINIAFEGIINDFIVEKNYIYFAVNQEIRFGDVFNIENTDYSVIKVNKEIAKISYSENYIFCLTKDMQIAKVNKISREVQILNPGISRFDIKLATIAIADNNSVVLFDGYNHFYGFYTKNNTLEKIYSFEYTDKIDSTESYNKNIIVRNGNTLKFFDNHCYGLKEIDIKELLTTDSVLVPKNILADLNLKDGQVVNQAFSNPILKGCSIVENDGLNITESAKFEIKNQNNLNKTFYFEMMNADQTNIEINTNNKKLNIEVPAFTSGQMKIFIVVGSNKYEAFIFDNKEEIKVLSGELTGGNGNSILLSSKNCLLEKIFIFNKELKKRKIDYFSKNTIATNIHSSNIDKPFSIVKTDKNGNAMIQSATSSVPGIVKITDNIESKAEHTALSVLSGAKIKGKIDELSVEVEKKYSQKTHKHNFSEILNVPFASLKQRGLVFLSNVMGEDDDKAATVKMVYDVHKLANHKHPYLTIDGSSTKNGDFSIKGKLDVIKNVSCMNLHSDGTVEGLDGNFSNSITVGNKGSFKNIKATNSIVSDNTIETKKLTSNAIVTNSLSVVHDISCNKIEASNGVINSFSSNSISCPNISTTNLKTTNINATSSISSNSITSVNGSFGNIKSTNLYISGYLVTIE